MIAEREEAPLSWLIVLHDSVNWKGFVLTPKISLCVALEMLETLV